MRQILISKTSLLRVQPNWSLHYRTVPMTLFTACHGH